MKPKFSTAFSTVLRAAFFLIQMALAFGATATIRYVKPTGTAVADGLSWANASGNLQAMIDASSPGDEVWVAYGIYKPTPGTDRTISFRMKNGVAIYGGFAGTETQVSQRAALDLYSPTNASVLSGDLLGNDVITGSGTTLDINNNEENSYIVVANRFDLATTGVLSGSAILDGFRISGGSNQVTSADQRYTNGGGMFNRYASPTLRNLLFLGNYGYDFGGGMANIFDAAPALTNVIFDRNVCQKLGGGMANGGGGNPSLNNVSFLGNMSYGSGSEGGGGLYDYQGNSTLYNCRFEGNGSWAGGAATFTNAQHTLRECVFVNNTSFSDAGGIQLWGGSLSIFNSLFSGNRAGLYGGVFSNYAGNLTVTNSTISGNYSGSNISTNFPPYTLSAVLMSGSQGEVTNFKNSVIWGNGSLFYNGTPGVSYSLVQGGFSGTGNLDADPQFLNAASPAGSDGKFGTADDGLSLKACSPALNTGDNNGVLGPDLTGSTRIFQSVVDMGAYESQSVASPLVSVPPVTRENALHFDGVNDHVALINSCGTDAPIVNGGDEITIEYWFKGSNIQSAVRLQPDGGTYIVAGWNGLHILSNDGGTGNGLPVGAAATDGRWHHVAMTWKRFAFNGFKSYLDGKLVAQRTASSNALPVVNSGAFLGAFNGNYEMMNGTLAEVRIWNVARTQAEIQSGLCGISMPQTGLVAWYSFRNGEANGNNTAVTPGVENLAQPGYYKGLLKNFGLNGTSSNWVTGRALNVTRLYVKPNTSGTSNLDGLSWQNAFSNLQDALDYPCVSPGLEIWVAAGTYKPTTTSDRSISFRMKNDVAIYGGFNGTETLLEQRNFTTNVTILSGDLNGDDVVTTATNIANNGENSYRVIANEFTAESPLTASAVLDGFTITGGRTEISSIGKRSGGGMYNLYASPTLRNLIFFGNVAEFGGGGLMNALNCSPTLTNVTFDRNFSQRDGGAIYNFTGANTVLNNVTFTRNGSYGSFGGGAIFNGDNSTAYTNCYFDGNFSTTGGAFVAIGSTANGTTATFLNCTFTNNSVNGDGGGLYLEDGTFTFENCLFYGQRAGLYGGAIRSRECNLNLTNCTIVDNRAATFPNTGTPYDQTGVIGIDGSNPIIIKNSVIWGNQSLFNGNIPVITYSNVQGGYTGTGNISVAPIFSDISTPAGPDNRYGTSDDGLALRSCSPGINAGDNAGVTATDLVGNTRIFESIVDMGPYEVQAAATDSIVITASPADASLYAGIDTTVTFNAAATGAGIAYQWQVSTDNVNFTNLGEGGIYANVNTASLQVSPTNTTAGTRSYYRCVVTNACRSVISGSAMLSFCDPITPQLVTTNNAISLNGSDWSGNYVSINAAQCAEPIVKGGDKAITIEFWFKGSNVQSAVALGAGQYTADIKNYVSSGLFGMHSLSNDGGTSQGLPMGASVNDGTWHHVAMTWTQNTVNGFVSYLDGQIVAQRNSSNNPLPEIYSNINLGFVRNLNNNYPYYTNGTMDNVCIWSTARTQAEIQAGMCQLPPANTPGLKLCYTFDNGSAGRYNAGINTVENVAKPWTFQGTLRDFALNGDVSNWVAGKSVSISNVTACESYTWNGVTYTSTGLYSVTLPGAGINGCDSTAYLNLFVRPLTNWYQDADGDGWYVSTVTSCSNPIGSGWTRNLPSGGSGDCDDANPAINPGAAEVCDRIDNNCNGLVDDGVGVQNITTISACNSYTWGVNQNTYYQSGTYIYPVGCDAYILNLTITASTSNTSTIAACGSYTWSVNGTTYTQSGTYQSVSGCHTEVLNLTITASTTNTTTISACESYTWGVNGTTYTQSGTYTNVNGCHTEVLNLTITPLVTWYTDADGDGYGIGTGQQYCSNPGTGWANRAGDCNDGNGTINPGATEVCGNSLDDNCDGNIDEGCIVIRTWYRDKDGDGFGINTVTLSAVNKPSGYVLAGNDCNDSDPVIYPGAPELGDGKDNNCDGQVDEGLGCRKQWYIDRDNDGYGSPSLSRWSCVKPAGYADNATDCRDTDPLSYPGATEVCGDGIDNDCDGLKDEGCGAPLTWYLDKDKDGYGNAARTMLAITKPMGYVSNSTDCNDSDASMNPGATETGDGKDNDCDGQVDEGLPCLVQWYVDRDKDGFGSTAITRWSCVQPAGYVSTATDCRDLDATIYPGAPELCDGKDNDCDRVIDEACTLITGIEGGTPETATKPLAKADAAGETLGVKLWPNPARDVLMVTLDEFVPNQKVELTLMQADGKVQQAQSIVPTLKGQQVRMDVSRAAGGYYILAVKQSGKMINRQVVIIR